MINVQSSYSDKETRDFIENKLTEPEFQDALYNELAYIQPDPKNIETLTTDQICNIIIERNLLEKLINSMHYNKIGNASNQIFTSPEAIQREAIVKNELMIYLKVNAGRCFSDFGPENKNFDDHLSLSISFLNQRFITREVEASPEPQFNEAFILKFDRIKDNNANILNHLQTLQSPISFVLQKVNKNENSYTKEAISVKEIEWRFLLEHGKLEINVEFPSILDNGKSSCGFVNIFLELLPKRRSMDLVSERNLEEQLQNEKKAHAQKVKRFYDASSEWWKEYKSINPDFEKRAVKIYCGNEHNQYKPIFTYITPLRLRGIDSPQYACRFVSQIPFHRTVKPGGEKTDCWKTFHTFLSEAKGDSEDHSNFLCSILLGFGLEAYVCVGLSSDGGHFWVNILVNNYSRL